MLPEGATVERRFVVHNGKDGGQHAEEEHEKEHGQVEVVGSAERPVIIQCSLWSLSERILLTHAEAGSTAGDGTVPNQGPGWLSWQSACCTSTRT